MDALATVFADPSYRKFMRLAAEAPIPGFVKEGALDDDFNVYPADAFGDPGKRRYPLNNRSNTWLSREYFEEDRGQYPKPVAEKIGSRIEKAASFWKLEPRKERAAPAAGEYHRVLVQHGGKQVFYVDIRTAGHYKEAAEYLVSSKAKLTYDMRRSMARGLCAAPDKFRCQLEPATDEYLRKAAGLAMTTGPALQQAIMGRVAQVHRRYPELSQALVKTAQVINETGVQLQMLPKVAGMLDIIDRAVGLHHYYGRLATPEEAVYGLSEKTAADFVNEAVTLTNGKVVSRSSLLARKKEVDGFFNAYFGETPYKDDGEMVSVISSLPRPEADALCETVKPVEAGV